MNKRYEVLFDGSAAEGRRRVEIMRQVQRLLGLDAQRVAGLFEREAGEVLFRTSKLDRAQRLIQTLRHIGVNSRLRDTVEPDLPDWEDWQLIERGSHAHHSFRCRSCLYTERLPVAEALPTTCPACGAVAARYQPTRDAGPARPAVGGAFRADADTDPRRSSGARRLGAAMAVAALCGVLGYLWQTQPRPHQADTSAPAAAAPITAEKTRTLQLVEGLVATLVVTPGDAQAGGPTPWRGAAAPASGAAPAAATDATEILDFWAGHAGSDPLLERRLQAAGDALLDQGKATAALRGLALLDRTPARWRLLHHLIARVAPDDDARRTALAHALQAQHDGAKTPGDRVVALLGLGLLESRETDADLLRLLRSTTDGADERATLQAMIAGARAAAGDRAGADRWFAEANLSLGTIQRPLQGLRAAVALAQAYRSAGDAATADALLRQVGVGIGRLDADAAELAELRDMLLLAVALEPGPDLALDAAGLGRGSAIERELQRAEFVVRVAARGDSEPAAALATLLTDARVRAHTRTRLASLAQLDGDTASAAKTRAAARHDLTTLDGAPRAVVASLLHDAAAPETDLIATTTAADGDPHGDTTDIAYALIARGLAWQRDTASAQQAVAAIGNPHRRGRALARVTAINELTGPEDAGRLTLARR